MNVSWLSALSMESKSSSSFEKVPGKSERRSYAALLSSKSASMVCISVRPGKLAEVSFFYPMKIDYSVLIEMAAMSLIYFMLSSRAFYDSCT